MDINTLFPNGSNGSLATVALVPQPTTVEVRPMVDYRLPDGRLVAIFCDVCRMALSISGNILDGAEAAL